MESTPPPKTKQHQPPTPEPREDNGPVVLTSLMFLGVTWLLFQGSSISINLASISQFFRQDWQPMTQAEWVASPLPLAMDGGDPYLRALMRTISASESNMSQPYHLLYGGKTIASLAQHPKQCVPIVAGPNVGQCTTAAGRYQFLDSTWQEKAHKYHPHPPSWYDLWKDYSFEPEDQDIVVYQWLADTSAWGVDIPQLLREGQIKTVLKVLSGTWTSLGYGIETNSMSSQLPKIYDKMLAEELAQAK